MKHNMPTQTMTKIVHILCNSERLLSDQHIWNTSANTPFTYLSMHYKDQVKSISYPTRTKKKKHQSFSCNWGRKKVVKHLAASIQIKSDVFFFNNVDTKCGYNNVDNVDDLIVKQQNSTGKVRAKCHAGKNSTQSRKYILTPVTLINTCKAFLVQFGSAEVSIWKPVVYIWEEVL